MVTLETDLMDLSAIKKGAKLVLSRPPTTDDELWWAVYAMFGVQIPRIAVCADHVAPFTAFAHAYFAREPHWALWYGSRGTGKSFMLAILALFKAAVLEIQVVLLGGSAAQSRNVHEHVETLMRYENAPSWAVTKAIQTEMAFGTVDNWIRPLPASQRTVRGPHPHMTLLDEIDEMDKDVYDAAMGQALMKPNSRGVVVEEMVVASSTWQNPAGTFSEVMKQAKATGMPIFTWCWREVCLTDENPTGWMNTDFIERKRLTVPAEMFRVEYELGEPSGASRAFDLDRLNKVFVPMPVIKETDHGFDDMEWVFAEPEATGQYVAGADWAKEKDWTVIVVARIDVKPHKIVYLRKVGRRPWPFMTSEFNRVIHWYGARAAHDGTGIGNVVHDMVDERTHKVVFTGQDRTDLLVEYVAEVENFTYQFPRNIPDLFDGHKDTTVDEVWIPSARWDAHLNDFVAACAVMNRARAVMPPPATAVGAGHDTSPTKAMAPLHRDPVDAFEYSAEAPPSGGAPSAVRVVGDDPDGVGGSWGSM